MLNFDIKNTSITALDINKEIKKNKKEREKIILISLVLSIFFSIIFVLNIEFYSEEFSDCIALSVSSCIGICFVLIITSIIEIKKLDYDVLIFNKSSLGKYHLNLFANIEENELNKIENMSNCNMEVYDYCNKICKIRNLINADYIMISEFHEKRIQNH